VLPIFILAGGFGTRLGSITEKIPKILAPVGGKPFLQLQIDWLIKNRMTNVTYCVGHLGDQVSEYISTLNIPKWMRISFSHDGPIQLGTGGAILKAIQKIEGKFLITYGDSYLTADLLEISEQFSASSQPALMCVYKNSNNYDKSNVEFKDSQIIHYSKNNCGGDLHYIDYGILGFEKDFYSKLSENESFDLGSVIQSSISSRGLLGIEVQERFYEIGSIKGISDLEAYIAKEIQTRGKQ
jgi:MurNAc alpha-1-phosphate uridylyltransferase